MPIPISQSLANAIRSASVSTPIKPPLKPRYRAPKSEQPLSLAQKQRLIILSSEAWRIHGEPDGISYNKWRHEQCFLAAKVGGLTKAGNQHYKALRSHFLALLGRDLESVKDALTTGPNPHAEGETIEDAEQAIYILRAAAKERSLSESYLVFVARQRYKKGSLDNLKAKQAMTILFEIARLYVPVAPGQPSQRKPKGPNSNGGKH